MADNPTPRDPAAARFWMLQLLRLAGMAMVLAGAGIAAGRIEGPPLLGPILLVTGLVEFFLVPIWLARRWKRARK